MGDRGTGKSTIVRSLIDLLPYIETFENDPYNSDPEEPNLNSNVKNVKTEYFTENIKKKIKIKVPMVTLPLGATEDRVCGTINIEKAISEGIKAFEPGLLAKANRGILYVDEVNLLDDHLVDVLLDSAASGWNTVEREGISISHPSKFILIGSGNPEEGELRPQLLDRFGMHALIKTVKEPKLRVKIVQLRDLFEKDPKKFREEYKKEEDQIKEKIIKAGDELKNITINYNYLEKIAQICSELNIDGLRGDLVINRSAKALTALEGSNQVTQKEIAKIITLCLRHRLRKDPLESVDTGQKVKTTFNTIFGI